VFILKRTHTDEWVHLTVAMDDVTRACLNRDNNRGDDAVIYDGIRLTWEGDVATLDCDPGPGGLLGQNREHESTFFFSGRVKSIRVEPGSFRTP
jgi:hypothetical protein